jgi:hypothetical protein
VICFRAPFGGNSRRYLKPDGIDATVKRIMAVVLVLLVPGDRSSKSNQAPAFWLPDGQHLAGSATPNWHLACSADVFSAEPVMISY